MAFEYLGIRKGSTEITNIRVGSQTSGIGLNVYYTVYHSDQTTNWCYSYYSSPFVGKVTSNTTITSTSSSTSTSTTATNFYQIGSTSYYIPEAYREGSYAYTISNKTATSTTYKIVQIVEGSSSTTIYLSSGTSGVLSTSKIAATTIKTTTTIYNYYGKIDGTSYYVYRGTSSTGIPSVNSSLYTISSSNTATTVAYTTVIYANSSINPSKIYLGSLPVYPRLQYAGNSNSSSGNLVVYPNYTDCRSMIGFQHSFSSEYGMKFSMTFIPGAAASFNKNLFGFNNKYSSEIKSGRVYDIRCCITSSSVLNLYINGSTAISYTSSTYLTTNNYAIRIIFDTYQGTYSLSRWNLSNGVISGGSSLKIGSFTALTSGTMLLYGMGIFGIMNKDGSNKVWDLSSCYSASLAAGNQSGASITQANSTKLISLDIETYNSSGVLSNAYRFLPCIRRDHTGLLCSTGEEYESMGGKCTTSYITTTTS